MTVLAPRTAAPDAPRSRRTAGLIAHLGWEAILLLLVGVATVVVLAQSDGKAFGQGFWLNLATAGLLASAFAFSLRTATPNLAVASLAMLAGIIYAKLVTADWPGLSAAVAAVLLVVVFGLILGVLTGLTSAPAWAVSLGGLGIAQAISFGMADGRGIVVPGRPESWTGTLWMVVFVLGSLAGGAAFLVPGVRKFLGANGTSTGQDRFQPSRLVGAVLGFGVSSLLAAVSGVVLIGYLGAAFANGDGGRLLVAVAAALLGGVSAVSGRGGIAGTVLATALLVLSGLALTLVAAPSWVSYSLPAGVAILIGVPIGWVLERISGSESQ